MPRRTPPASAHPPLDHRLRRMVGRDPGEPHRTATPLELLFDLTFVVAFSQAGSQAAHLLELGHFAPAFIGFSFAVFAICWAWINYSWLASAYDNDDVFFRVATMVADARRLLLALGMPDVLPLDRRRRPRRQRRDGRRLRRHARRDDRPLAAGRAPRPRAPARRAHLRDRRRRSQVGWVAADLHQPVAARAMLGLSPCSTLSSSRAVRSSVAWAARRGIAHHIAERYGLLVIITLGEVVLGTILAISAVVEEQGWTVDAALVAFGGTALAFGMWWVYFTMPSGKVLHGSGTRIRVGLRPPLHLRLARGDRRGAARRRLRIEGTAHIGDVQALLTVVVPVAVFSVALFTLYSLLLQQFDPFHIGLFLASLVPLAASIAAVDGRREHGHRHRALRVLADRRDRRLRDRRTPTSGGRPRRTLRHGARGRHPPVPPRLSRAEGRMPRHPPLDRARSLG